MQNAGVRTGNIHLQSSCLYKSLATEPAADCAEREDEVRATEENLPDEIVYLLPNEHLIPGENTSPAQGKDEEFYQSQVANCDSMVIFKKQGGRYKSWKRRWFILNDNCLYYFEFTTDKEPRGIIPLENIRVCTVKSSYFAPYLS